MQKKSRLAALTEQLSRERSLSEHERVMFARSLAATPDERWAMHVNFLRSHDLYERSRRRKYGFKS